MLQGQDEHHRLLLCEETVCNPMRNSGSVHLVKQLGFTITVSGYKTFIEGFQLCMAKTININSEKNKLYQRIYKIRVDDLHHMYVF